MELFARGRDYMQYEYERFTPDRFQEFCQALLAREYQGVQCYPVGQKDGGRDAILRTADRSAIVFQVKFKRERLKGDDPYSILKSAVDQELPKVKRLADRGAKSYVIMTNLGGSAALDVGAMDRTQTYLDATLPIPAQVWWRSDLDARLLNAYDLRWEFSEIVTSSDMLRMLVEEGLGENSRRRMLAITAYLMAQYEADEFVKFKQADLQASDLLSLFIDVPVSLQRSHGRETGRERLLQEVFRNVTQDEKSGEPRLIGRGSLVGGATLLAHASAQDKLTRVVIEGGPGQGKSTLAQYICQIQRMRFLGKEDKLDKLPQMHRSVPARVPFKVDLRDLSSWLRREDPITGEPLRNSQVVSLESFLAAQICLLSGGQDFTVDDLTLFLSTSPALIVLDGLDEVATLTDRRTVIDAVSTAAGRIEALSPRTQVLVTSRPAAAANTPTFNAVTWDYLRLEAIREDLIYEYTDRWGAARGIPTQDIEEIKRILRTKLPSRHVKDLARNAMQLTILLNLVHIRGQALPDHRTELYDRYIDVFFNREADKNKVVLQNRQLLIDLHGYLAWRIHAGAEARRANGRVSQERLREMITDYLVSREHGLYILDDLLSGVVQRIVALVSRVEGTFEFEVQPLREYFAARHLYNTAPYSPAGHPESGTKPEIFDAIAPNPFWLNVTRFYAGCYSVGELPGLAEQIEEMLTSREGSLTSFPRGLAASLLGDRVFNQAPKVTKRVASIAIDPLTLRYSFGQQLSFGNSVGLSLPADCGMQEAAEMLMKRCLSQESPSARREAAFVMTVVAPQAVRSETWLRATPDLSEDNGWTLRAWLEAGAIMGVVEGLNADDALRLASSSSEIWTALIEGGHPALLASPDYQRRALAGVADQTISLRGSRGILGRVGSILDPSSYTFHLSDRDFLGDEDLLGASDQITAIPELGDFLLSANEWRSAFAKELDSSREPWDQLIRVIEGLLGRCWLSYRIGAIAVGRLGTKSVAEQPRSALSDPIDLAFMARQMRSKPKWWGEWAAELESDLDRRSWMALLFGYANASSIRANMSAAEELARQLSGSHFRDIASGLMIGPIATTIPSRSASPILGALSSGRLRIALATRTTPELRRVASSQLSDGDLSRDPILADMALEWLLKERPNADDVNAWRELMDEAARLYRFGSDVFAGMIFGGSSPSSVPAEVAKEVLRECDRYPASLIWLCDRSLSAEHQRRLRSVAAIAKKEGWSAN